MERVKSVLRRIQSAFTNSKQWVAAHWRAWGGLSMALAIITFLITAKSSDINTAWAAALSACRAVAIFLAAGALALFAKNLFWPKKEESESKHDKTTAAQNGAQASGQRLAAQIEPWEEHWIDCIRDDLTTFSTWLHALAESAGVELSERQYQKFRGYQEKLEAKIATYLTAVVREIEIVRLYALGKPAIYERFEHGGMWGQRKGKYVNYYRVQTSVGQQRAYLKEIATGLTPRGLKNPTARQKLMPSGEELASLLPRPALKIIGALHPAIEVERLSAEPPVSSDAAT